MAAYVAEYIMIELGGELGRINHLVDQILSVGDGNRSTTLNGLEWKGDRKINKKIFFCVIGLLNQGTSEHIHTPLRS
jgi:hypothetical protein